MIDNLRQAFLDEAVELLDELEFSLLELEKETNENDPDLFAKVFRSLHTFKGSSGMFGYNNIALFIHDIETVYDYIRKGDITITNNIISLTLSAKDQISYMLGLGGENSSVDDDKTKDILIAFKSIITDHNFDDKKSIQTSEDVVIHSAKQNNENNNCTYHIRIHPFPDFFLNGTNPVLLLNEFRRFGPSIIIGNLDITSRLDHFDPSKCYSSWDAILTTSEGIDVIKDVFVFVDEEMCALEIRLLDNGNLLNNKSAHRMLGQLLIDNHDISKDDVTEILKNLKILHPDAYDEKFSDYKRFEKLKEEFRNSGLTGIVSEIKNIIADINECLIKLEGDAVNNNYEFNISEMLRSIIDISDYLGFKTLTITTLALEKLMVIFINKPGIIDSKTVEVFLQGIDYLNKTLDSVLSNIPIDDEAGLTISIEKLIAEHSLYKNVNTPESDDIPDIADDNYLKEFLVSTNDMLETLEENVLDYEKTGSSINLNEIFRIVHSIKGDSSVARLNKLVSYTNILENLLYKLRNGQIIKTAAIIDIIQKAAGTIKNVIEGLNRGNFNLLKNQDIQILKDLILVYEKGNDSETTDILRKDTHPDPKTAAFINQVSQYKEMIQVSIRSYSVKDGKPIVLERLLKNLENAAKYVKHDQLLRIVEESKHFVLNGQQNDIESSINSLIEYLNSLISEENPLEFTKINNDNKKNELNDTESEKEVIRSDEKPKSNGEVENRTMRVDEYKIDGFSNMIGELVIARNSYEYLLREVYSTNQIEQTIEKKLNDNLHLFSRLTNDLQVGVMTLRMIPLKSIFQKYSRVVRDIAKKQNKKIEFVTLGNETEVDKKIADSLSDPLIHLIRNSCDHGIELPEERVKLGKPETGTVLLKASIEGGKLIIVINDDGKGLDREKIYEKAQKMGFNMQNYDDDTILYLIFEPGFSTKTVVSELSGRGVGMDVVKTTIDKLGGSYSIKTEKNVGTEISFVIPMSIGLSNSLLVEAKGETFALPVLSVVKTLKLKPSEFIRMHDRIGFNHRGEVVPAANLTELLNGKTDEFETQLNAFKEKIYNDVNEEISVVIMQSKLGNYGIIVDKLMKNMELSIKPVPECMANSNVISGVSILGDGNVVLVLNPDKLV